MLYSILFFVYYLLFWGKSVPLQCVFHSIRFKVNKGWSTAVLLFYFIRFMALCWLYIYCSKIPLLVNKDVDTPF